MRSVAFVLVVLASASSQEVLTFDGEMYDLLKSGLASSGAALEEAVDILVRGFAVNGTAELMERAVAAMRVVDDWLQRRRLSEEEEDCANRVVDQLESEASKCVADACWDADDWKSSTRKAIDRLEEVAQEIREMHDEFPAAMESCSEEDYDTEVCEEGIKLWTKVRLAHLLRSAKMYLELAASIRDAYREVAELCLETLRGKVEWMERDVVDNLNGCLS